MKAVTTLVVITFLLVMQSTLKSHAVLAQPALPNRVTFTQDPSNEMIVLDKSLITSVEDLDHRIIIIKGSMRQFYVKDKFEDIVRVLGPDRFIQLHLYAKDNLIAIDKSLVLAVLDSASGRRLIIKAEALGLGNTIVVREEYKAILAMISYSGNSDCVYMGDVQKIDTKTPGKIYCEGTKLMDTATSSHVRTVEIRVPKYFYNAKVGSEVDIDICSTENKNHIFYMQLMKFKNIGNETQIVIQATNINKGERLPDKFICTYRIWGAR